MDDLTTIDKILAWLKDVVENKKSIAPSAWVELAQKTNVLLEDEHKKLYDLFEILANQKVICIRAGGTVSQCKLESEALSEHKQYQLQKAKIGRVEEMIRLSKIMSRLKDNEWSGS